MDSFKRNAWEVSDIQNTKAELQSILDEMQGVPDYTAFKVKCENLAAKIKGLLEINDEAHVYLFQNSKIVEKISSMGVYFKNVSNSARKSQEILAQYIKSLEVMSNANNSAGVAKDVAVQDVAVQDVSDISEAPASAPIVVPPPPEIATQGPLSKESRQAAAQYLNLTAADKKKHKRDLAIKKAKEKAKAKKGK